jgi:hypothetical protein
VRVTAASGGSLLFDQYRPFAILKPKNRKTVVLGTTSWRQARQATDLQEPVPGFSASLGATWFAVFVGQFSSWGEAPRDVLV